MFTKALFSMATVVQGASAVEILCWGLPPQAPTLLYSLLGALAKHDLPVHHWLPTSRLGDNYSFLLSVADIS